MKKFIYMMMLAVGFMTSCSDDDVVSSSSPSVDNNKIVFTTKSDKMQTRGGVTLTSLSKFDVTAVTGNDALFFKSQQFLYNSTGGFFESTPSYFWPAGNNDIHKPVISFGCKHRYSGKVKHIQYICI